MNSAKLIKETVLQKFLEEKQLLKSEDIVKSLRENMGNALSSFADVRVQSIGCPQIPCLVLYYR
jgi:hypothetical protein